MMNPSMNKACVMIGAGGHARVLLDILARQGTRPVAIFSPDRDILLPGFSAAEHFQHDAQIEQFPPEQFRLINGIGYLPGNAIRFSIQKKFSDLGYEFASVISDRAFISPHAKLASGIQIMDGCIVNHSASIGPHCVINTAAVIEHDCKLDSDVMLSPAAVLCGSVHCKTRSFIGAGATVIQNVIIGVGAQVAAGAVVVRDLQDQQKVYPARQFYTW